MKLKEINKIACPCCGKTNVAEYEICEVCNWENDPIQNEKPDLRGGANKLSLNEAAQAFKAKGQNN